MCFSLLKDIAENWLETEMHIVYWEYIFLDIWLNENVADVPHYYHKETEVSVLGIDKQY